MLIGRDLYSMAEWWIRQSMAGDKGGSFNIPHYIEYLKARNSCLDYCTIMNQDLQKVTNSQVKHFVIGSLTNLEKQELTSTDTL
jgi:hypothetical protein